MKKQLVKLETELKKLDVRGLKFLNNGIGREEYISFFQSIFPSQIPSEEVLSLYELHNGSTTDYIQGADTFYVIPNFFFLSTSAVLELLSYEDESPYKFKKLSMLPLFSSGHGEYLVLDTASGKIIYCATSAIEFELYASIYDSMSKMFETINAGFKENGYYKYEDNPIMETDKYYLIAKRMNPNSDFWGLMARN